MTLTREPDDNNPHNARHPHPGYECPSYAESVRAEPVMEPIADRLFNWWSVRVGQMTRLEAARHFGWNCRFAGDVLFYLRDARGVAEAVRKGGPWRLVSAAETEQRRAASRPPTCDSCFMALSPAGTCLSCA